MQSADIRRKKFENQVQVLELSRFAGPSGNYATTSLVTTGSQGGGPHIKSQALIGPSTPRPTLHYRHLFRLKSRASTWPRAQPQTTAPRRN